MDRYIRELRIFTQSFWSPRYEWVQPAPIQKLVLVEANNMNGRRCVCPGKSEICFKMKSPGREAGPLGSPDHVYCRAGFYSGAQNPEHRDSEFLAKRSCSRAVRFNSRRSGGANTILPKVTPARLPHNHTTSAIYP